MGAVSGGTQVRMAKSCANRLRFTTVSAALTVLGVGGTTARMSSWTTLMKHRCVCVRACGVRVGGHVWTCYTFHLVSLLVTNLTGLKCSIPVGYGGHQSSFCSDPIPGVFLTAPLWHAPHP